MKRLEEFLKPSQSQLFQKLYKKYQREAVCYKGKYLLVKGEAPVLLVAHLDTVHEIPVRTICASQQGSILMSPQGIGGDDRCGVYALTAIWETAPVKPWLLFTCDEETGGHGARAFAEAYMEGTLPKALEQMKMIIEIDRRGCRDAVYYNCANDEFEEYISSKGFQTDYGSFSDISIIAPAMGVAAVNLSAGYYNAHTLHEFIDKRHLNITVEKVQEIIAEATGDGFPRFEYIENICYEDYGRYGSESIPKSLPGKYREFYDILLDYFSFGELENYRKTFGNVVLHDLYRSVLCGL